MGGTSGGQFLVNSDGQVMGGTWQGDILSTTYGGTGTTTTGWTGLSFVNSGVWSATTTLSQVYGGTGFSSYSSGDIVYAGTNSNLTKLPIDSNGKILTIIDGLPSWTSTSSLGMDISEISGILPVNQGGTGQNFTGTDGFMYLNNGVTILCENAEYAPNTRSPHVELINFQIINGGQTSHSIFEVYNIKY